MTLIVMQTATRSKIHLLAVVLGVIPHVAATAAICEEQVLTQKDASGLLITRQV
jgi:hypothetical protein